MDIVVEQGTCPECASPVDVRTINVYEPRTGNVLKFEYFHDDAKDPLEHCLVMLKMKSGGLEARRERGEAEPQGEPEDVLAHIALTQFSAGEYLGGMKLFDRLQEPKTQP
ncbi:MAG: hypothetical protein KJ709_02115 [Nanoarchaeota archaeon]|nr:hypothetical protein [Nanoarchaeota archaeon]